jgi:hypothetical protein
MVATKFVFKLGCLVLLASSMPVMDSVAAPPGLQDFFLAPLKAAEEKGGPLPRGGHDIPQRVMICHRPGTEHQRTLTLGRHVAKTYIAAGATLGPCLNKLLPFLQKSNVIRIDTGRLLEAIRAGKEVQLPCAPPGGQLTMIQSRLTEQDLTAPGSDLPFLNTYEIPIEEVDARGRIGVFSITEEDFRSWVTDPSMGMCFAEPIGPLLRLNNVPESRVKQILAVGNTVVYNVTDAFPGPINRSHVDHLSPIPRKRDPIHRKSDLLDRTIAPLTANRISPSLTQGHTVAYSLRGFGSHDRISPGARPLKVKHRTGADGDTVDFGVLFIGYVADLDFQKAVGPPIGSTGALSRRRCGNYWVCGTKCTMPRCTPTSPLPPVEGKTVIPSSP